MTPPGTDIPPSKDTDLQESLDALVSEMTSTTKKIEDQVAAVQDAAGGSPLLAPTTPPAPKDLSDEDLAGVMNGLLAEASNTPQPAEPQATGADAAEAIESLDAQLAELTSQLLDNKPAENINGLAPVNGAATQVVEPQRAPEPPVAQAPPPPPEPAAATPPKPPEPAPEAPPKPVVTAIPTPSPPPPAPVVAHSAPVAAAAPVHAVSPAEAAALVAPIDVGPSKLLLLLASISKPLISKPKAVQVAVTLLAVNTLLVAVVLWTYLIVRSPIKGVEPPAYNLAGDNLPHPQEAPEAEPAGAAKGGEGHEGKAAEGHGEAAKDEHGASKAKKPPAKAAKPAKPVKKPPAKKPEAPKGEGHGE